MKYDGAGGKNVRDVEKIFGGVRCRKVPNGCRQPVVRLDKSRWYELCMIGIDAASSAQSRCAGDGGDLGAVVDVGGVVEGLASFGGKGWAGGVGISLTFETGVSVFVVVGCGMVGGSRCAAGVWGTRWGW